MSNVTNIASKLAEVAREVAHVEKDRYNTGQKYAYASADAVLSKVNEALTSRGIALMSAAELVAHSIEHREGRAPLQYAVVRLTLNFVDSDSGETMMVQGLGSGVDAGDKAVMKANTAALKYAYANAFTISWGDDPEADESVDETDAPKETKKRKAKSSLAKDYLDKIASVARREELETIKPEIISKRAEIGESGYTKLVIAYKNRLKTFEEGTVS